MKKIALITSSDYPNLTEDDRPLLQLFSNHSVNASAQVWDDPLVDWEDFDLVILRSCWDYHKKFESFVDWIHYLKTLKIPLMNHPLTVLWNLDKKYLLEIEKQNLPIVPSRVMNKPGYHDLAQAMTDWHSDYIILKPTVSASALNTFKLSLKDLNTHETPSIQTDWIIQPFLKLVETEGEVSMFYYGSEFCHAIRKVPKAGDFRVQSEFGGKYEAYQASAELIDQGLKYLRTCPKIPSFARVDLMPLKHDQWVLGELEVIEPALSFAMYPQSLIRFVEVTIQLLNKPSLSVSH